MATSDHPLPGFLRLPRELRDEIYRYLLDTNTSPPLSPCSSELASRWRFRNIHYPPFLEPRSRVAALSNVNPQIRSELRQTLHGPNPSPGAQLSATPRRKRPTAHLDIMVSTWEIYPTWTSLPFEAQRRRGAIFDLVVTIRTFPRSSESFLHHGAPVFASLLHLLGQLVREGPALFFCAPCHREAAHRPFRLGKLEVKLRFVRELSAGTSPADQAAIARKVFGMLKALAQGGVAGAVVEEIWARAEIDPGDGGALCCPQRRWAVCDVVDPAKAREWGSAGFYYAALEV